MDKELNYQKRQSKGWCGISRMSLYSSFTSIFSYTSYKNVGMTMSIRRAEAASPKIRTYARPHQIGSSAIITAPIIAVTEVRRIGRIRVFPALMRAVRLSCHSFLSDK